AAVASILESVESGDHEMCSSTALLAENDCNPDVVRRRRVEESLAVASIHTAHSRAVEERAIELQALGFGEFDAYHLASAEVGECDRLITCDDRFLKAARRNSDRIGVTVADPLRFLAEPNIAKESKK